MRYLLGLTAFLAFSSLAKADVVITSVNDSSGSAIVAAPGEGFQYNFTTGDAWAGSGSTGPYWRIDSLTLFASNANTNTGDWTVSILSGSTTLNSQNFTNATTDINKLLIFNLTSMTSTLLNSNSAYSIKVIETANPFDVFEKLGAITTPTTGSTQFSSVSGAGVGTTATAARFELAASAVPEPGTLLLGGIAAACGGTGVWWKRRKRQPQPETTEQSAAI